MFVRSSYTPVAFLMHQRKIVSYTTLFPRASKGYSTLGHSRTPSGTGLRPDPRRLTVHGVSAGGESGCFLAGRVGPGGGVQIQRKLFRTRTFHFFEIRLGMPGGVPNTRRHSKTPLAPAGSLRRHCHWDARGMPLPCVGVGGQLVFPLDSSAFPNISKFRIVGKFQNFQNC